MGKLPHKKSRVITEACDSLQKTSTLYADRNITDAPKTHIKGNYSLDEKLSSLLQKIYYFFHVQLLLIDQCIDIIEDSGNTL